MNINIFAKGHKQSKNNKLVWACVAIVFTDKKQRMDVINSKFNFHVNGWNDKRQLNNKVRVVFLSTQGKSDQLKSNQIIEIKHNEFVLLMSDFGGWKPHTFLGSDQLFPISILQPHTECLHLKVKPEGKRRKKKPGAAWDLDCRSTLW